MKQIIAFILIIMFAFSTIAFSESYDSLIEKAKVYASENDYEKALASYQLAERINPESTDAYVGEAGLCFALEQYTEAVSCIDKALEIDPLSTEAWYLKCRIDITLKDINAFAQDKPYAEVCGVDFSDDSRDIANMYMESWDFEQAVKYYTLSGIDLQAAHRSLIDIGFLDIANDSYDDEGRLATAIKKFQECINTLFSQGILTTEVKYKPISDEILPVSGIIDPMTYSFLLFCEDNPILNDTTFSENGYRCYLNGEYERAGYFYEKNLEFYGDNYGYASSAAMAYLLADNQDNAERMLRKCIEIEPLKSEPYVFLKSLYSSETSMPEDVSSLISKGFEITGDERLNLTTPEPTPEPTPTSEPTPVPGPTTIAVVPFGQSFSFTTQINPDGTARYSTENDQFETLTFTLTVKDYMLPSDFASKWGNVYKLQGTEAGVGFELTLHDYTGTATIVPQNIIKIVLQSESGNTENPGFQLMDAEIAGQPDVTVKPDVPKMLWKRYAFSESDEPMKYLAVTTYTSGAVRTILFELSPEQSQ